MLTNPQRVALVLAIVIIAALSATVVQCFFGPDALAVPSKELLAQFHTSLMYRVGLVAVGVVLIWTGVLLIMVLFGIHMGRPREIRRAGSGGSVVFGLGVVEDVLRNRSVAVDGVQDLRISVLQTRQGLVVKGDAVAGRTPGTGGIAPPRRRSTCPTRGGPTLCASTRSRAGR